jgi:hypothetical protein
MKTITSSHPLGEFCSSLNHAASANTGATPTYFVGFGRFVNVGGFVHTRQDDLTEFTKPATWRAAKLRSERDFPMLPAVFPA